MASLMRIGVNRLTNALLFAKNDVKLIRTITSRAVREQEKRPPKPAPWPYHDKGFNQFTYFIDKTSARMDENSKIVVVEGPVAACKSKFAKDLACELDMLYMPEANLDMVYINSYGYDLRQLDEQLPESCRSFDINNFLVTPNHQNTANFQIMQYQVKYSQYIDALAHVLSTGQGVVLDRCCYSDFVFTEAMASQKYMSKAAKKLYYDIRANTITELLRPHLIIYLDVPVKTIMANIKKRAISFEKNSSVLTPAYLEVMEHFYKQKYLKEMSTHAELLIYDWSEGGEVEVVVEDVERVNFNFDSQSRKMKDWEQPLEDDWGCIRHKYADRKDHLMAYFNVPGYHVPEMVIEGDDVKVKDDVMDNAPGQLYLEGYNADMGDEGILFKLGMKHRDTLPLRERVIS